MTKKDKDKAQASVILEKLEKAEKVYKDWTCKFSCTDLAEYYEGAQLPPGEDGYVTNLFYSTYQVKEPNIVFHQPIFNCTPRPWQYQFDASNAMNQAQLATDVLNSFVVHKKTKFPRNILTAILDSGSHFGVVEVGYDATWKRNPNAGKPVSIRDVTDQVSEAKIVEEPALIPQSEWIYVKRIPPENFRVSRNNNTIALDECDWVGYYDFIRVEDVKDKTPGFRNFETIAELSLKMVQGYSMQEVGNLVGEDIMVDNIKVFKFWDLRQKKFFIVGCETGYVHYDEKFKRLPLFDLRFTPRRNSWYPIPFFFNWKSPQDEYNEARTQMRNARRRSKRIYTALMDAVDQEEKDKLITGPDGTIVDIKRDGAIQPLQNPPLDSTVAASLQISKDDFNIVSATTSETRGQADRTTATQADITNARAQVRETSEKEIVAEWLQRIAYEILLTVSEQMTLPMWVKNVTGQPMWLQNYADMEGMWNQVSPLDLRDADFEIAVDVDNLSPLASQKAGDDFLRFLAVLTQYPILSMNPILIQEAAFKLGYRNGPVIQAFQQAAMAAIATQAMQSQPGQDGQMQLGPASNASQKTAEQMQPPNQAQIENQIAAQQMPSDMR